MASDEYSDTDQKDNGKRSTDGYRDVSFH